MTNKISVIIPVYNVAEYLVKCVESVMEQDIMNLEVLLIDDGSTDGSSEIADDLYSVYSDKIKVFHNTNHGLSYTRNFGIRQAAGDYVMFLDSDDYWEGPFAKELLGCIAMGDDVIITKGFDYIYPDHTIELRHPFTDGSFQGLNGEEVLLEYAGSVTRRWSVWQNIYRRDFLLSNELFFPLDMLCEDVAWTFDVIRHAESVGFLNKVFYQYVANREGSIMNTGSYKRWHDLNVIASQWLETADKVRNSELRDLLREIFTHLIYHNIDSLISFDNTELMKAISYLQANKGFNAPISNADKRTLILIRSLGFMRYISLVKMAQRVRRSVKSTK